MSINSTEELKKEIVDNALQWCRNNETFSCSDKRFYSSPRISSEFPDCSTPFSMDIYNFCSGGCVYCFAFYQKSKNPAVQSDENLLLKSVNVKNAIGLWNGEKPNSPYYKYFITPRKVLHLGGMADGFDNFEAKNKIGVPFIELLLKTGYPTIISTKFPPERIAEYKEMLEKYKDTDHMAFQFSIITADDNLARQIEIGIPSPSQRFASMKYLSDLGYFTILRLRPFIIGITDYTLKKLLEQARDAGAKALSTEFFAMDMRSNEDMTNRYKYLSALVGTDLIEYYKALSPPERGTYRRLNRKVKEKYVKIMYKFCVENNMLFACSDPDFKELNMTGSCCGLPDDPKWGLNNYCRNQLTRTLADLRRRYWKSNGVDKFMSLKDVFKFEEENAWWEDNDLYRDACVCKSSLQTGMVFQTNHKVQFIKDWNNINSPKSPYCYFHGKVEPAGLDSDGNFIFSYVASDYEHQWRKEGIDLTK